MINNKISEKANVMRFWCSQPAHNLVRLMIWASCVRFSLGLLEGSLSVPLAIATLVTLFLVSVLFVFRTGIVGGLTESLILFLYPIILILKFFSFLLWVWYGLGTLKGFGAYLILCSSSVAVAFSPVFDEYKYLLIYPILFALACTLILPLKWCLNPLGGARIFKNKVDLVGKGLSMFFDARLKKLRMSKDPIGNLIAQIIQPFDDAVGILRKLDFSNFIIWLTTMIFLIVFTWTYLASGILFSSLYKAIQGDGSAFETSQSFSGSDFDFFYIGFREMSGSSPYGVVAKSDLAKFILILQSNAFFYLQAVVFMIFTIVVMETLRATFSGMKESVITQVETSTSEFRRKNMASASESDSNESETQSPQK